MRLPAILAVFLLLGCKDGSGGTSGASGTTQGGSGSSVSIPEDVGGGGEGGQGGSGGAGAAPACEPACGCHIGNACYVGTSPQRCGIDGEPCHACPTGQGCADGFCADVEAICVEDPDCDDDDPCTEDTCGGGQCFHFPIVPQECEGDGWCNVGALACDGKKVECCHGCLLLDGDVFLCIPADECPAPSYCSDRGLCVL